MPTRLALLALLLAASCGEKMKNAASVADQFVDRYYVESDQAGAMSLTSGVASLRLRDELKLAQEGRSGGALGALRQVRVYYKRDALEGNGDQRNAAYRLDIRPQGGGALSREAHLELSRQADGTWRVSRFNETNP
ncbi:MAG: hypothetical protein ACJ783_10050 [Myxococcales bacterium]